MTDTLLTVTDSAQQYLQKLLADKTEAVFRLTIKKTGCSGYSYHPELTELRSGDTAVQLANGTTIYLDSTWLHLLQGITMDYIEEDKMGLKQKRLEFLNPNESGRCGCGESFHVS